MNKELLNNTYHLKPGALVINKQPMLVNGFIGSGLFVSLWDKKKKYSGCCSFQHPKAPLTDTKAKYADVALNHLINQMKQLGSDMSDLRAHLIGGSITKHNSYGEKNVNAARKLLAKNSIGILSSDTGGTMTRKFVYYTRTGETVTAHFHQQRKEMWFPYSA
ncbi:MAG: hypothetical protein K8S56_03265 [Candidatus Cloacimonetes bacterium]|nr:hypothetical protein [Candidatus Cloacimonadota bacterium]